MPVLNFDNLNVLNTKGFKKRAEDYSTYFGDMDLTESQKKERIKAAEDFEEDMFFFIVLIVMLRENGYYDYSEALTEFENRYRENVSKYINDDDFLGWYPRLFAADMLNNTLKNISDPWYTSDDRVMFNAENEANTVLNRSEYLKAIASGKKYKTWRTMMDRRVRKTHRIVENKTIPIDALFTVGKALMRFPHDYELAGEFPEELISCRCSVFYS